MQSARIKFIVTKIITFSSSPPDQSLDEGLMHELCNMSARSSSFSKEKLWEQVGMPRTFRLVQQFSADVIVVCIWI